MQLKISSTSLAFFIRALVFAELASDRLLGEAGTPLWAAGLGQQVRQISPDSECVKSFPFPFPFHITEPAPGRRLETTHQRNTWSEDKAR